MKMVLLGFGLALMLGNALESLAQAPTDNAYQTFLDSRRLPRAVPHWTDSLPWTRVFNIQNYQNFATPVVLVGDVALNWLPAFERAQNDAVAAGGGVVYFPRLPQRRADGFEREDSAYYFADDVKVKSNIIIRGENPSADSSDARSRRFKLPTYFRFPKFEYDEGIGRPGGTANTTAFKSIIADNGATNNVAIVNVDINRGGIYFQPDFTSVTLPGGNSTQHAVRGMYNILVLGVRNNNVAEPSPNVPSNNIDSWHRWPYRFTCNINLFVDRNAVIANCRVNDFTNNDNTLRIIERDDFQQNNYKPNNTPGGAPLPGNQATFRYTDHYGVSINRLKRPVRFGAVTGGPLEFRGTPNLAPFTVNLAYCPGPCTFTGADPNGWNLIGNPYPGYISVNLAQYAGTLQNTLHTWRNQRGNGQWASITDGVSTNGASYTVAPGQSFFVRALTAGATFSLTTADLSIGRYDSYFQGDQFRRRALPDVVHVSLMEHDSISRDEVAFRYHAAATRGEDLDREARNMANEVYDLAISHAGGPEMSIIAQPLGMAGPDTLDLHLKVPVNSALSLKLNGLQSLTQAQDLFLLNKRTGVSQLIADDALLPIDAAGAYAIIVQPHVTSLSRQKPPILSLRPNPANTMVQLQLSHGKAQQITITDNLGRKVLVTQDLQADLLDISKLAAGTYLVSVKTEQDRVSQKLVVLR